MEEIVSINFMVKWWKCIYFSIGNICAAPANFNECNIKRRSKLNDHRNTYKKEQTSRTQIKSQYWTTLFQTASISVTSSWIIIYQREKMMRNEHFLCSIASLWKLSWCERYMWFIHQQLTCSQILWRHDGSSIYVIVSLWLTHGSCENHVINSSDVTRHVSAGVISGRTVVKK